MSASNNNRFHSFTHLTLCAILISMFGWLFKKIFFIVIFAIGIFYAYQNYAAPFLAENSPQTKQLTDNVLGTATTMANKEASKSARLFDKILFKQASRPFLDQYAKLPKDKQAEIKKQICK